MKSQTQPWWGGHAFRWTFVVLFLLIASVFIDRLVNNSDRSDRQEILSNISEKIIVPWQRNDSAEVEKLLADFAQANNIIYLNLSDKKKGYFAEYRHEDYGDYELANLRRFVHDGNTHDKTSWAVFDRGVFVGTLEVIWQSNSLPYGPQRLIWPWLLLLGAVAALIWGYRFMARAKRVFQRPEVETQSNEIFASVAHGLHFNVRIHEVVLAKNPGHVMYGYVSLEWLNGKASKENFSFGSLSELLSSNSLALPIFPWILRNLLLKKIEMAKQGASYPFAFAVIGDQFVDDDFRFFLFKICNANKIPTSSILIEVEEGFLANMNPSVLDATLRQWRSAGVEVIVSNFGSTNISELILSQFNIDKIKWDAAWLNRQWLSSDSRQRVLSLQSMAKERHMATVLNGEISSLHHGLLNDLDLDLLQKQDGGHVFKLNNTKTNPAVEVNNLVNLKMS